jgi:hypothetical protein
VFFPEGFKKVTPAPQPTPPEPQGDPLEVGHDPDANFFVAMATETIDIYFHNMMAGVQ